IWAAFTGGTTTVSRCRVVVGTSEYLIDVDQAANATTITTVAKRLGLPDHAVTIALATVLQESKLHNLPYGDRDSLGLFQQRPSEGWGSPVQLLTPSYAAAAFYQHLQRIDGWQQLPVAAAAQEVQHSADGSAYAVWEEEARALARALTGEVIAAFSCRFATPQQPLPRRLSALADRELGAGSLTRPGNLRHDWLVAQWLVAHAYSYGVTGVTVRGQRWTHDAVGWRRDPAAGSAPSYVLAPARSPG